MITQKTLTLQRFKECDRTSDPFRIAILAILYEAEAREIIRYKTKVGKSKVYWAYYLTASGKKRATFISPKEFQGYRWFDEFSTVINMKSGEVYQVSDRHCTCPSWEYQVKTGKKSQCKHQVMRSSLAGSGGDRSREIKVQINSCLQFLFRELLM